MALFVLVLDSCKKDAAKHGCQVELEKFVSKIQTEQRLNSFSSDFPYPYLVKKQFFGRQKRLVAVQRQIKEHTVVCFVRIMIRGDDEYQGVLSIGV